MTRAETSVEIHDLIAERRSPRSFDATATMDNQDLLALLEAARWAPSSNNLQPWKYIAGKRGDENFELLLNCLVPFNQSWAGRASVFIAVAGISQLADGTDNLTYMYDCGLSVSQLTIEAHHRGYVVHQMGGFDRRKAGTMFDGAVPIVIIAIGKQAAAEQLEGAAYDREVAPRTRKELSEIVIKGLPN